MSKLSNSWNMMKASATVLKLDPELLIFPLLSGIATVLVTATFVVPFAFIGEGFGALENLGENVGYLGYAVGFLYYLVLYSLIFFFNTALVATTMIRLDGGDPTVSDGLNLAFKKLGTVLEYAAIAATVGMLLRALEERAGFIGRIIIGLIGLSWTLATFLTVPVLVTKDVSAIDAVKESASVFKRTWGEQVVANAGIGFATFMIFLLMGLVAVPLIILTASISEVLVIPLILSFAGGFLLLILVSSALKGIYSAALYRYATTGDAGEHFSAQMMEEAFREKRRRW
ncbi:MAG: hypothetical protein E4G90_07620 [Gemmatimonadales bacterium]|nr:DUF6159 family protein [Longimicrobiales bacterium]TFH64669.1 MAG: hypothetical protein E4G90_07620 [Gemmatimonadales bacterium]